MSRDERKRALERARLYGIVDLGYVEGERVAEVAGKLLAGGAGALQLRAKGRGAEEIGGWARELAPLCREAGVPFIVNDFPEIAVAAGADGVHLGQGDGSLAAAREVAGEGLLAGRSTHSPEQARGALAEGFDYIGFGPLFPTPTKEGRPEIGLEGIREVEAAVGQEIPVFCIGGVNPGNLAGVVQAGARRVVMVSALLQAPDIEKATREGLGMLEGSL